MTLTQQNRTRLTAYLTAHRTDWHDAGTEAAIKEMDLRYPNDGLLVAALAVAAARNTANRGPASMLTEQPDAPVTATRIVPSSRPVEADPCPDCGSKLRRNDGECVGCYQNRNEHHVNSGVRCGTGSKPSPEAQRLIGEFRAGYVERARAQK